MHGDYAGDYGLQRKGVGRLECFIRVPLIMAGPGIAAHPAARADFFPRRHLPSHLRNAWTGASLRGARPQPWPLLVNW